MLGNAVERGPHRRSSTEEEGPGDAIDDHILIGCECRVIGRALALRVRNISFGVPSGSFDLNRLRHSVEEEQRADAEPNKNAFRQVAEDDEQKGHDDDNGITPGSPHQRGEFVLLGPTLLH